MDLIDPNRPFDIWDPENKIYSRTRALPPHYVSKDAKLQNSIVSEGCRVYGTVDFSVLFSGVTVEEGAVVRDSVLMPGAVVKRGAEVHYAILAPNVVVEGDAVVGERPENIDDMGRWGIAVVGENRTVGKGAVVKAKAMCYDDVKEGEIKC